MVSVVVLRWQLLVARTAWLVLCRRCLDTALPLVWLWYVVPILAVAETVHALQLRAC
jgi:hypothetical protein